MSQIETIMGSKGAMVGLAIVAFLVAALLVLVIVRMLFGGRLRMPGGRARQARLGIVDAFDLDRQRQLIIVRRDNTEHLIMIGGPNDVLIESEIVRVEARDFRDSRRDKDGAFQPDGRIPAPSPVEPRAADQPMLPMAPPDMPDVQPAERPEPVVEVAPPPRAPTFPLPPRRPMQPPMPERRPPTPPRLPDSVSRGEEPVSPAPNMTPTFEIPPPIAPQPVSPPPLAAPPLTAPARTVPPPFLKPLPPRPPLRPLQRATPVTTPTVDGEPKVVAPPLLPPKPVTPVAPPPPPAAPESNDALESLEEEMAKLLGRGPG